jgi:hypothetical protein
VSETWYHGGYPGLAPGDILLPPDESGATHTLSQYAQRLGAPHGTRRDCVYLTNVQQVARAHAAMYPDGALYECEPDGSVEPDPDAPGLSVMVERARIVAVVRPRVVFAHRTPESWIRLMVTAAEKAVRS